MVERKFLRDGSSATLHVENLSLNVTACNSRIIRVQLLSCGEFTEHKSVVLVRKDWPEAAMKIKQEAGVVSIQTKHLKVRIKPDPLQLSFLNAENHMLTWSDEQNIMQVKEEGSVLFLRFPNATHFYGLGEGGAQFDRKGKKRVLWNAQRGHENVASDLSVPFLVTNIGCGFFFHDTTAVQFDISHRGELTFRTSENFLDWYFLYGPSFEEILRNYILLTGESQMPPLWALGYLQSTRHFKNTEEVLSLGPTFRVKKLPCDALIFLSTYQDEGKSWNKGVGFLDFEKDLWAKPKLMVNQMHKQHFHVILHEYPFLHPDACQFTNALEKCSIVRWIPSKEGYRWGTTAHVDYTNPRACRWWWQQHQHLVNAGIDGWWLDGGEGPDDETSEEAYAGPWKRWHNVYDLLRLRSFYEGESRDRPHQRPFMLSRSGYAGMQRYGASCWSGDIPSTFETLKAQVPAGVNVGLSGVPYWGTDIGGFYPTQLTSELYVRWFQFGAFCPLFRGHGREWRKRLPWWWGKEVESICKKYLELRYRLLPYIYTLAYEARSRGLPLMRALVMYYPQDENVTDLGSEYLWGRDILVAPVTEQGAQTWRVYLPKGNWYNFWTNERVSGQKWIETDAPLERLPLFIRGGATIPMGPIMQYVGEKPLDFLTLLIHPEGESEFTLYEDDGKTRAYEEGAFALSKFECIQDEQKQQITILLGKSEGHYDGKPHSRTYHLQVYSEEEPDRVIIDGKTMGRVKDKRTLGYNTSGWWHDGKFFLHIQLAKVSDRREVRIL